VFNTSFKVQDFYDSDECLDEVKFMMEEARSHGVAGVPFTIIENRWAVSGGQGAETYLQVRSMRCQLHHT
jgi:predicted DsbA family dithiol-disulfide isomerase